MNDGCTDVVIPAMCHFGIAYNLGININRPVTSTDTDRVEMAVHHASLASKYSKKMHQHPSLVGLINAMFVSLDVFETKFVIESHYFFIFTEYTEHSVFHRTVERKMIILVT